MAQRIVGREAEVARLERFLTGVTGGPTSMLLTGEEGIGKTTLWKEGLAIALQRGYRVLACRLVESESKLSFTALADLFDGVLEDAARNLPTPQRSALDAALLRGELGARAPDPRGVGRGILAILRALSSSTPIMVAIDDVQWLDPPSGRVLGFALRRLEEEPVGILVTAREPVDGGSDHAEGQLHATVPDDRVHTVSVGPLPVEALGEILCSRLGTMPLHPTLVQLHRTSGGNPFFALEIARTLLERGTAFSPGDVLPVPDNLRDMVRDRLSALPGELAPVLLTISALNKPTMPMVEASLGKGHGVRSAVRFALRAGVVELEGDGIRFTHPLMASVVYGESTLDDRRKVHRRLASVIPDLEERARHSALGAEGPDAEVAAALDAAAFEARGRGAPDAAAELCELARRLTPPEREEDAVRRSISAAENYAIAGDVVRTRRLLEDRTRALLEEVVGSWPESPGRDAAVRQIDKLPRGVGWEPAAQDLFKRALRGGRVDIIQRAAIERGLAWTQLASGDLASAARHARTALSFAEQSEDRTAVAETLAAATLLDLSQGGGGATDVFARATALPSEAEGTRSIQRPSWMLAVLLKWTDELEESRSRFEALYQLALERGDEASVPGLLWHVSELEWRLGDWKAAVRRADEGAGAAARTGDRVQAASLRGLQALVHANVGAVELSRTEAEEGRSLAEASGGERGAILAAWALASLALLEGRAEEAHLHLEALVGRALHTAVSEPFAFRFLLDEAEALVALGHHDQARSVLEQLHAERRGLGRNWVIAASRRCGALLDAARGELREAVSSLDAMIESHEVLREPFELGRALLVAGTILRRAKEKRGARRTLERAQEIFDEMGAQPWATRARAELGRIGGRAPSRWELTRTEMRLAELVAEGKTNQEIAAALFVTVNTVQSSLRAVYRKLGVRSRTELAVKMTTERSAGNAERGNS